MTDKNRFGCRRRVAYCSHHSRGFVALFFVLSLAAALSVLVFGLTQRSGNLLMLLQSMREHHNSRAAARFCLQRLIHLKVSNIGYRPALDADMQAFGAYGCRYDEFSEESVAGSGIQVDIGRSGASYKANALLKFSAEVEGFRMLPAGSSTGALYKVRREFYITDAL